MKLQFDSLLSKQMSRREFLQYVGSVLLVVVGISSVMRALQNGGAPKARSGGGYGSSSYGGNKLVR